MAWYLKLYQNIVTFLWNHLVDQYLLIRPSLSDPNQLLLSLYYENEWVTFLVSPGFKRKILKGFINHVDQTEYVQSMMVNDTIRVKDIVDNYPTCGPLELLEIVTDDGTYYEYSNPETILTWD